MNLAFGAEYRTEEFIIYSGEEASYGIYDENGILITDPSIQTQPTVITSYSIHYTKLYDQLSYLKLPSKECKYHRLEKNHHLVYQYTFPDAYGYVLSSLVSVYYLRSYNFV